MAEDTMFQEAVEALREGDKTKAKDLLTKLLKTDQNNTQYWIWLSAVVESTKERIYCLQTALKLEPENATAKQGLILLGALPPDESVKPFSLDRRRLWDEKLALDSDKPKEKKSFKSIITSPTGRLAGFGLVGVAVIGFVVFGLILPNNRAFTPGNTNTPGPSPTFTLTPTFVNATGRVPGAVKGTLVPLAELLDAPHTPTPFYVNTPRQPQSIDNFRVVKLAYENQDWDAVISGMSEISRNEPDAADPYYFIGEAYRFKGDHRNALEAYNQALRVDPQFGPAYLGLARARLMQDPSANILALYEEALRRDPNFGEVYLDRAIFYLNRRQPELALADLTTAERLLPGPLVFYYQARTHLALDNTDKAEAAALKANEGDPTMLLVYFTLGEIYLAQGKYVDAIEVLQTYVGYETRSATARAMIGEAYYQAGDCETAIEALNAAISMDSSQRKAYLYRGLCYVEAENADAAESDLERALQYFKDNFELSLGMMRTNMLQEHFGDAYLQGEQVLALAETDEEKARAYYWRGLNFEQREELDKAAESWQELLALPRSAVTREMRAEAQDHFYDIYTPTPTLTPAPTRTATKTSTPIRTLTPVNALTSSKTPTKTPTPTN